MPDRHAILQLYWFFLVLRSKLPVHNKEGHVMFGWCAQVDFYVSGFNV